MSIDPKFIEQLTASKAEGQSADSAAENLLKLGPVASTDLARALTAVYDGLTPADLAKTLHRLFPNESALQIGTAVLIGLPNTTSQEMLGALTGCGFAQADAQSAVTILYPQTVTIQATSPWQTTNVTLTSTQTAKIACAGTWTADPEFGTYGPDGGFRRIDLDGYTMPGQAEGAVIGKVGQGPVFLVGAGQTTPAGQSGLLQLCINDDLTGRYGAGLTDNNGSMVAVVTTTEAG